MQICRVKRALCLAAALLGLVTVGQAQTNGTVVAWGSQTTIPVGLSNVVAIAAKLSFNLALRSDGTVVAWGDNTFDQTNVPASVSTVVAIAAGSGHGLALKADGNVVAWGANYYGQTNVPPGLTNVTAIAAGSAHSLALKSDGTVVAWGDSGNGESKVPAGLSNITAIAAGDYTSAAIANGKVVAWGANGKGETNVPAGLSNVVAIAANSDNMAALKANGTVVVWGFNGFGQLNVPAGLSNVVAIAVGNNYILALRADGTVVAWGGQTNVPAGISSIAAIAAGGSYILALRGGALSLIPAPDSLVVPSGRAADLRRGIIGFQPRSYQWFFNNTNFLAGATNFVLRFPSAQHAQAGTYCVVVTNSFAALTSSPVALSVLDVPPNILTQPLGQTLMSWSTLDLLVGVDGSLPMAYQWFFGTNGILLATNSTLHLTNVQTWQAGPYTVVVTNVYGGVTSTPAILQVIPVVPVTICSEAALRAAMAGGGTVTFACDGTITLSNTISISANTVLDGSGHQITISGNHAVRVFYVNTNVTLTLLNLTIANGYSTNGGAIYNDGGNVTVQNCIFSNNQAVGIFNSSASPGLGQGGAIFNLGNLTLQNCDFTNNQAIGGDVSLGYGGNGQGGAIFNTGTNVIDNCTFRLNSTRGGNGGSPNWAYQGGGGGAGAGGAIYNSGSLTISRSSFTNNSASGIAGLAASGTPMNNYGMTGGSGGAASGGAIYNSGSLLLQSSTVAVNTTSGGGGGTGGPGPDTVISDGIGDGGTGGNGGSGSGALFNSGTANLVNVTVALNSAAGGGGGQGGTGGKNIANPVRYPNWHGGRGGTGGAGGGSSGGIQDTSGFLRMTNCTVASNAGVPGAGGSGGTGGLGTAPNYPLGPTGSVGASGAAVGGVKTLVCVLANTLLASNNPANWSGTVTDAGHNLSSDASCVFTGGGSLNNTDPKLGPLADNGGPTWTMALLPGSPAIDADSAVGAPATDQRGVPRPQGSGVDIGAFEYQYIPVFTQASLQGATNCLLRMAGLLPNQTFTLQVSSNFLNWSAVTSFTAGTNGMFQLADPMQRNWRARFYRLKSGAP